MNAPGVRSMARDRWRLEKSHPRKASSGTGSISERHARRDSQVARAALKRPSLQLLENTKANGGWFCERPKLGQWRGKCFRACQEVTSNEEKQNVNPFRFSYKRHAEQESCVGRQTRCVGCAIRLLCLFSQNS